MNYQKIILAGKIISEPVIIKTEEDVLDKVTFKVSVHFFTENEIILPVVAVRDFKEIFEIQVEKDVLIEGIIDRDQSGGFFIFVDYIQSMNSEMKAAKKEKLLF